MFARRSSAIPDARPPTIRRNVPPCSATYIVPAVPGAPFRNAIATGLDNPAATARSLTCAAAKLCAVSVLAPVLEVGADFPVGEPVVVGAGDVGAVDDETCGEPLLAHAPNMNAVAATTITISIVGTSLRTERRLGRGYAYDPSLSRCPCEPESQ